MVEVAGTNLDLEVDTNYPWDGDVRVRLEPAQSARLAVRLRIPGWARGTAVPGGLYRDSNLRVGKASILVNGKPIPYEEEKGYAVLKRVWQKGYAIELKLPMEAFHVEARGEMKEDRNRVALVRGPLVYCVEGADNEGRELTFIVDRQHALTTKFQNILDESVVAISQPAREFKASQDGLQIEAGPASITAIPYYCWANRDNFDMQVWLPTRVGGLRVNS